MKNADYLHSVLMYAINGEIRPTAEHKLARTWLSTCSSVFGELRQQVNLAVDGKGDAACRGTAAVFVNVVANVSEVADGRIRPANNHSPGYRSSIIFPTSE